MSDSLTKKTLNAAKWSSITEICAKIVAPIINMVLARILAPEAFGILATITMVISFAEVFVESGFQKFLIQHEFTDLNEESQYLSVAFWTNLIFSVVLWLIIILFQRPIARISGNEELGYVIAISGIMIPMYGIIGIQNCIIKKKLEFKKLFYVRIPSALVPLVITLPLALLGFDYWALVIGNIAGVAVRSILLFFVGRFRPHIYFNWSQLKYMLKFGAFTMLDGLALWATNWIDSLLIANTMSGYELGLYKNSIAIITSLFSVITAALTPVLYASLSRLQNDEKEFAKMFMNTQKLLCVFLLPLGLGIYLYRELATQIILGNKWNDATFIVGIMAIMIALRTIFVSINSEAFRAKGKFQLPLYMQLLDLAILIPTCIMSSKISFKALVYARAFVRMDLFLPELIALYCICKISPKDTMRNLMPSFVSALIMCLVSVGLQQVSRSLLWSLVSIIICVCVYFGVMFIFKSERMVIIGLLQKYISRRKKEI